MRGDFFRCRRNSRRCQDSPRSRLMLGLASSLDRSPIGLAFYRPTPRTVSTDVRRRNGWRSPRLHRPEQRCLRTAGRFAAASGRAARLISTAPSRLEAGQTAPVNLGMQQASRHRAASSRRNAVGRPVDGAVASRHQGWIRSEPSPPRLATTSQHCECGSPALFRTMTCLRRRCRVIKTEKGGRQPLQTPSLSHPPARSPADETALRDSSLRPSRAARVRA